MEFTQIAPAHEDLVHDIAFDYYGERFATCSSDKHIKIWTLDDTKSTNKWSHVDISRAHRDSIWRLSWASPEFGQVLASCSEDGSVCVFEEQESALSAQDNGSTSKWVKKIELSNRNSKKAVNDVEFANRSLGIKLATASADGYIRIYEARDVFNLNEWELMLEHQVEDTQGGKSISSSEHGLTCLAWCDCPFEPAKIAVGGYSKRAVVFALERNNTLREECVLGEHESAVHDIAWAPPMGRSYHLIATACREPKVYIYTLKRNPDGTLEQSSVQCLISTTNSPVWRIAWNATGTVLATSSEDGTLSLWRLNFAGTWINVQDMPANLENKMKYYYRNP